MTEPTLSTATTVDEVLEATARRCWHESHNGQECPPAMIPTVADLNAYREHCDPAKTQEANTLLAATLDAFKAEFAQALDGHLAAARLDALPGQDTPPTLAAIQLVEQLQATRDALSVATWRWWIAPPDVFTDPELVAVLYDDDSRQQLAMLRLEKAHQIWREIPKDRRPRYPLVPLVEAWQAQPKEVDPYWPARRARLSDFDKVDAEGGKLLLDAPLPTQVVNNSPQLTLDLPELDTPTGKPWLVEWFDRLGLESLRQGRGMAWPFHIGIGAIAHLPVAHRDGQWHVLRLDTAEVIRWLHPNGWRSKSRDWANFPAALDELNRILGDVYIPGLGAVDMLRATIRPTTPTEPLVEFVIRIPKVAANGARIDWPTLCRYRQGSAALYRAYLTACELMHQSAHNGQPITRQIPAPILDKDGKPMRGRGGKVKRSAVELVANPASRYVKGHTTGELADLIGMTGNNREHRKQTIKAFRQLDKDGVIDLAQAGKLWRIYGPRPMQHDYPTDAT